MILENPVQNFILYNFYIHVIDQADSLVGVNQSKHYVKKPD